MSYHHININQLTNIESNYYLGVNARECARRMKIGKDKVYTLLSLIETRDSLLKKSTLLTSKIKSVVEEKKSRVISEQKVTRIFMSY